MSAQPFGALASALRRARHPVSPRELIALQVVLDQPNPGAAELRAQVASVVARNPQEWQRVATLVDHWLAGELDAEGRIATPVQQRVAGVARPEPPAQPTSPRRLPTWVDRVLGWSPRRIAATFVAAVVVSVGLVVVGTWALTPDVVESAGGATTGGAVPPAAQAPDATGYVPRVTEAARTVPVPLVLRLDPFAWAILAGVGLVLWGVGARLRALPEAAREEEALARRRDEDRSRGRRQELETERLLAGTADVALWQVPAFAPLPHAALGAASSVLLRLRVGEGRLELDLPRTLRRTIDAGGRFEAALRPRMLPKRVLVWVEVPPEGEHAWSRPLARVLDDLATRGVELEVWTYSGQPDRLRAPGGAWLDVSEVARRTADLPVLVLGRALSPWSRHGRQHRAWVGARSAWARVAWVDPDPGGGAGPLPEAIGVRRFPFTELGVEGAARWLAGEERVDGGLDPAWAALPEEALWRWALAASLVPEAGWDQIEALRRGIPELERALPGPWAVRALLDWVARHPASQSEDTGQPLSSGRHLHLASELVEALQRGYRARAASDPTLVAFVRAVDGMLLDQLGADPPGDGLGRAVWELKTAWIRARREPERAAELIGRVLDGPLSREAKDLLLGELRRQAERPVAGADWSGVDRLVLRTAVDPPAGVPVRALARGARRANPRWARVVGVAVVLIAAGTGAWYAVPWATRVGVGPAVEAELPATYRLVEETGELRPAMVRVEPGAFRMGSPPDEADRGEDEGPVQVRITRPFALAATEVTQAQYRRVLGEEPFVADQEGVPLLGADYPAQGVTWTDALRFCNRLSELEGLAPAYDLSTDPPTWDRAALGYRLPTEAEWEYAARAGATTRFEGTDVEAEACRFANVADSAAKAKFPGWGTFPCDDGFPGLSPAGQFPARGAGLSDMGGNVREWVWDAYQGRLPGGDDPVVNDSARGAPRVVRGGSWIVPPQVARVAGRGYGRPSDRGGPLGFRPARSLPP